MTTLREAAQQVLEAWNRDVTWFARAYDVMDALRAALAQEEQAPVAWMRPDNRVVEESTARVQFSRGADKPPICSSHATATAAGR